MKSLREIFSKRRSFLVAGGIVIICLAVGSFVLLRRGAAADTYLTGAVQRGPIRNVVNATGTVQAVLTVQVGSQVSGQIEALYGDYNSVVKRGQLLARIDPRDFEARVEQARANVLAAQARVKTTEAELNNQLANLESAKANLEVSRVTRDNTAQILGRYTELRQEGILSQNDYDTGKANADAAAAKHAQATAAVEQVQAQINSSRAQVEQAKAQLEQTKAALSQAQVSLDYTSISSPVDGVVISRNVDVGQTVAASLQAPILFVIANDLTQMQVNANVDEADIGNISNASDIRFTVDAYPNRVFTGRIAEIRLNPQTIQNVVTYSVIVSVDNERLELKPGMTANLTITVAEQTDVLKVPNSALRYLPPGVSREQVAEMLRRPRAEVASSASPQPMADRKGTSSDGGAKVSEKSAEAGVSQTQAPNPPRSAEERRAFFQRMRELPESERQKMRERFEQFGPGGGESPAAAAGQATPWGSQEPVRQRQLAPGQMWNPAEKIRFPESRPAVARPAIVWVLGKNDQPEPRRVLLGITDGASTQVVSGELQETDQVIVGDTSRAGAPAASQQARPPFFGGPFGGGRR